MLRVIFFMSVGIIFLWSVFAMFGLMSSEDPSFFVTPFMNLGTMIVCAYADIIRNNRKVLIDP